MSSRKRKREDHLPAMPDTTKPTAVFRARAPRLRTMSMALPGSILTNALSPDAKTALCGMVARCAAVFCIDELVIFADGQEHVQRRSDYSHGPRGRQHQSTNGSNWIDNNGLSHSDSMADRDAKSGYTAYSDPCDFMNHILSYLETPPNLRRALFPHHPNLKSAGILPSLDMPHHMRSEEWLPWREGVSTENFYSPAFDNADANESGANGTETSRRQAHRNPRDRAPNASLVEAGLPNQVTVPVAIPTNTRVTLDFSAEYQDAAPSSRDLQHMHLTANAVDPSAPREQGGYYWGYSTRRAATLSAVFTESPFEEGYDFCIGTSERGTPLLDLASSWRSRSLASDTENEAEVPNETPKPEHLLVVFGGQSGLEKAFDNDTALREKLGPESRVADMFDAWVDLMDGSQGSRTIRTEEAIWIGCMGLKSAGLVP